MIVNMHMWACSQYVLGFFIWNKNPSEEGKITP